MAYHNDNFVNFTHPDSAGIRNGAIKHMTMTNEEPEINGRDSILLCDVLGTRDNPKAVSTAAMKLGKIADAPQSEATKCNL